MAECSEGVSCNFWPLLHVWCHPKSEPLQVLVNSREDLVQGCIIVVPDTSIQRRLVRGVHTKYYTVPWLSVYTHKQLKLPI